MNPQDEPYVRMSPPELVCPVCCDSIPEATNEPDDTELTEAEENASDFVSELEQYIDAS